MTGLEIVNHLIRSLFTSSVLRSYFATLQPSVMIRLLQSVILQYCSLQNCVYVERRLSKLASYQDHCPQSDFTSFHPFHLLFFRYLKLQKSDFSLVRSPQGFLGLGPGTAADQPLTDNWELICPHKLKIFGFI